MEEKNYSINESISNEGVFRTAPGLLIILVDEPEYISHLQISLKNSLDKPGWLNIYSKTELYCFVLYCCVVLWYVLCCIVLCCVVLCGCVLFLLHCVVLCVVFKSILLSKEFRRFGRMLYCQVG